jgi:hypothetical protein
MLQIVLVGLGAGAAAALLFASVASGSIVATFLFYLAPLPILIAALGWSHWAALIAAFSAAGGLAALLGLFFFVAFLIGVGLPAWWLGYLALLARPAAQATPDGREWYPVGRLVLWAALIGALIVVVAVPNLGMDKESFQAGLRNAFERAIRLQLPTNAPDAPADSDLRRLIDILVIAIPPAAAVLATVTNVVNLWLAGRIVKVSGRLQRPWPDLSRLTLPSFAPGLLAAAVAGAFLPDLLGIISGVLAASLLMAYAILGLAVLHAITRGMNSRSFVLAGTYSAVIIFGWPVLGMSLLGLADTVLDLRGRVAGKRGPPSLRT